MRKGEVTLIKKRTSRIPVRKDKTAVAESCRVAARMFCCTAVTQGKAKMAAVTAAAAAAATPAVQGRSGS